MHGFRAWPPRTGNGSEEDLPHRACGSVHTQAAGGRILGRRAAGSVTGAARGVGESPCLTVLGDGHGKRAVSGNGDARPVRVIGTSRRSRRSVPGPTHALRRRVGRLPASHPYGVYGAVLLYYG